MYAILAKLDTSRTLVLLLLLSIAHIGQHGILEYFEGCKVGPTHIRNGTGMDRNEPEMDRNDWLDLNRGYFLELRHYAHKHGELRHYAHKHGELRHYAHKHGDLRHYAHKHGELRHYAHKYGELRHYAHKHGELRHYAHKHGELRHYAHKHGELRHYAHKHGDLRHYAHKHGDLRHYAKQSTYYVTDNKTVEAAVADYFLINVITQKYI